MQLQVNPTLPALADCDVPALEANFAAAGFKPFHAARVLREFYESNGHPNLNGIDVGKEVASYVMKHFKIRRTQIAAQDVSTDGTTKLLIALDSGGSVESVLMPADRPGIAAGCVSSQIGCAMGCDFCASTRHGLERSLEAGEIVEQFLHLKEQAKKIGRRIKTLVFMGMGEPLLNYDAVIAAIGRIAEPNLGGLGWRQITVSTVGIIPGIDRLAAENHRVYLAVSLHAPDDTTRSRLVPMNRRYNVADIMAAARRFLARTHRIPTIEYCMLAGINDSDAQAEQLADLMQGFRAHLNLIPYNSIGPGLTGITYARPSLERMQAFLEILRARGVNTHFRIPRGENVNAACGQLRLATVS